MTKTVILFLFLGFILFILDWVSLDEEEELKRQDKEEDQSESSLWDSELLQIAGISKTMSKTEVENYGAPVPFVELLPFDEVTYTEDKPTRKPTIILDITPTNLIEE